MYTIYIKPECPYSQRAVNYLESNNVEYSVINVYDYGGKSNVVHALYNNNFLKDPNHTVPIVYRNKKYIGGCNELLKLKKL